jgi:hypothetical protein
MPKEAQHRPTRPAEPLAPQRTRPIREQLHEAVNHNITRTVTEGLKGIDDLAARGKRELQRRGITGMDEIADSAADLVKKLFIRGISK